MSAPTFRDVNREAIQGRRHWVTVGLTASCWWWRCWCGESGGEGEGATCDRLAVALAGATDHLTETLI